MAIKLSKIKDKIKMITLDSLMRRIKVMSLKKNKEIMLILSDDPNYWIILLNKNEKIDIYKF